MVILNGIEAMETGGTLTLGLRKDGDYAVVFVRDTGKGMNAEVIRQAEFVFFTTKPNGTGMGLTIARAVCIWHNGALRIAWSKPDVGTEIEFRIPI